MELDEEIKIRREEEIERRREEGLKEEEKEGITRVEWEKGVYKNPWPEYSEKGTWELIQWLSSRKPPPFPSPSFLSTFLPLLSPPLPSLSSFPFFSHENINSNNNLNNNNNNNNDNVNNIIEENEDKSNNKREREEEYSEKEIEEKKEEGRYSEKAIQVTWIGHSSFLVQMEGVNLLTDPVWSDRCSPLSFAGPKRYRPPPLPLSSLPPIHFVLVSHNHYDHLDEYTVKWFANHSSSTLWYVPKGMREWFEGKGIEKDKIVDMIWWDSHHYSPSLTIFSTPCQHWSKRSLTDTNKALWTSWSVIGKSTKMYFCGDTGYCNAFKETGDLFGPFDLALIPIGAYCPRWFHKNHHVDPTEAVSLHLSLRSSFSIGMHWGTFILTDEEIMEPKELLKEVLKEKNIPEEKFITMYHGETIVIEDGVLLSSSRPIHL